MQWHPLFKPSDLPMVTVESGKGRVADVFFWTELSNKDQLEKSNIMGQWHFDISTHGTSTSSNHFRRNLSGWAVMTPARSKHSAPASSLGNQPSCFEKKRSARWKCSLQPESQDGRNGQQTPGLAAGHVDGDSGQWSRLSRVPRSFKDEFCVEPKHTSQLLGNHLISTPCHIAAAVANRQSRCTHRCSDDFGLLVVRNVSEVPGVFCDAPFEATRDIALGWSKIPQ